MEIIEHTYKSNLPIKYVFSEGKVNKDHLVVVFSAFSPEKAEIKHSYNYIRSLQHIDCHRLFILDNYGPRGCYYLGENMNFEVETSVHSLISYITGKYGISQKNVITAGSSKGGSAALYFGLKYHYGHIIAGAPQTKIADYVLKSAKDTAAYIFGESHPSREAIEKVDQIIFDQMDHDILSELHLLSSENDSQFPIHIKPFLNQLNQNKIKSHIQINNEIKNHSHIAKHFPYFLQKTLYQLIYGLDLGIVYEKMDSGRRQIRVDVPVKQEVRTVVSIKHQDEPILEIPFEAEGRFDLSAIGSSNMLKKIDIALEILHEKSLSIPLESIIFSRDYLQNTYNFSIENNKICFQLDCHQLQDVEFAFYIILDNQVYEKIMYQEEQELVFPITQPGTYRIHYFVRSKQNGEKISNKTHEIEFTRSLVNSSNK
ncbi:hypothetical protein ACFVSW_01040 [Neobacillus sp. NPDC058068]|uniref:hypothetical protein n=1 Tax=Neobacillus sp. NPDC058068 TaxID=3346325 RepID=UPI0036DEC147